MPRSRTPSLSESDPSPPSGTPTPIEQVPADNQDRDELCKLRRLLAYRLMNFWRYRTLCEELAGEPDKKLLHRLEATRDIAESFWKLASRVALANPLIRHFNRVNTEITFGILIRSDANNIDEIIAARGVEEVHWRHWSDRYLDKELRDWEPMVPLHESNDERQKMKTMARLEREAVIRAYADLPMSKQDEKDYDEAEKLHAKKRLAEKRAREKLEAEKKEWVVQERARAQREQSPAASPKTRTTDPSTAPHVEPQRARTPIPSRMLYDSPSLSPRTSMSPLRSRGRSDTAGSSSSDVRGPSPLSLGDERQRGSGGR